MKHNHIILDGTYTFNAEDDFGDYCNGRKRKGTKNQSGYVRHSYICEDGKKHTICEHTAKWEYFNGKIPDHMEIDHIIPLRNGGTNRLSNLRLVTHRENSLNPYSRISMSERSKGKNNGMYGKHHSQSTKQLIREKKIGLLINREDTSKLADKIDPTTGEVLESYLSIHEASRITGISRSSISLACKGKFGKQGHKALGSLWYSYSLPQRSEGF